MTTSVPMKYYAKAQSTIEPELIASNNAFLSDVFSSEEEDPEKPVTCGFFRIEKGDPLVYTYTYQEMKIILEGEVNISDETGQVAKAVPGDVFHFPKGAKVTFSTDSYALAFFSGQRAEGDI